MSVFEAIVLGVVQGLTEFFPVSSSGHLVLTESLLGLTLPGIGFEVALHVATLVSVVFVYRLRIIELLRGLGERRTWVFVGKLALATMPAGVAGVLFHDWFSARFDDPAFAGTMLLVTGAVVWSSRWALGSTGSTVVEVLPLIVALGLSILAGTVVPFIAVAGVLAAIMLIARLTAPSHGDRGEGVGASAGVESQRGGRPEPNPGHVRDPGWGTAVTMGVAQAAAIMPGISRSGSTVIAGLWRRFDAVAAAEFSFLMSIPAILGAALLSLPDLGTEQSAPGVVQVLAGGIAAAAAGIVAIRFFVGMLRRRSFHLFAYYCWLAGGLFLLTR